jgi:hypothetical protein
LNETIHGRSQVIFSSQDKNLKYSIGVGNKPTRVQTEWKRNYISMPKSYNRMLESITNTWANCWEKTNTKKCNCTTVISNESSWVMPTTDQHNDNNRKKGPPLTAQDEMQICSDEPQHMHMHTNLS